MSDAKVSVWRPWPNNVGIKKKIPEVIEAEFTKESPESEIVIEPLTCKTLGVGIKPLSRCLEND